MRELIWFLAACLPVCSQIRIPGPGGMVTTTSGSGSSGTCTPTTGYAHCRPLTINHTQVGGSTLSNFAVLVNGSLGPSRIQNTNCYDVAFTSDSGGASLIPWEIETCSSSTGAIISWVGVSSISASADTTFYVSYDNASLSTAQNTGSLSPSHVWNSNYAMVQHLANGSSLSLSDSTSNGNNGTNTGSASATTGQIDGAARFNGTSQYATVASSASMKPTSAITVSMWVSCAGCVSGTAQGYVLDTDGDGAGLTIQVYNNGLFFTLGGVIHNYQPGYMAGDTNWHYLVCTYSGSTAAVYLDGSSQGSTSATGSIGWSGAALKIGTGAIYFNGSVDELRISNTAGTSNQITAEFNNQKSGSTFLAMGAEV